MSSATESSGTAPPIGVEPMSTPGYDAPAPPPPPPVPSSFHLSLLARIEPRHGLRWRPPRVPLKKPPRPPPLPPAPRRFLAPSNSISPSFQACRPRRERRLPKRRRRPRGRRARPPQCRHPRRPRPRPTVSPAHPAQCPPNRTSSRSQAERGLEHREPGGRQSSIQSPLSMPGVFPWLGNAGDVEGRTALTSTTTAASGPPTRPGT